MSENTDFEPTERSRVRRLPARGTYERAAVHGVFDEALICHVAFAARQQPFAVPTIHARLGDDLYLHGAPASRMLKTLAGGVPVCVTATLVDGLVLARSAFHHSMNYRSAMAFGRAVAVADRKEKLRAFAAMTDRVSPGRWNDTRRPTDKELDSTSVLRLAIEEASAKVRSGPPIDDAADCDLAHWAGVVPVRLERGSPEPAPDLRPGIDVPDYLGR